MFIAIFMFIQQAGDRMLVDEPIAQIETDKVNLFSRTSCLQFFSFELFRKSNKLALILD